ncbi:hypothetical protein ABTD96_19850 [Acinetobacter baumannii]
MSAAYRNGVLSVTIPVSEKAKPRRISVSTDDGADVIAAHESTPQPIEQ